MPRPRDPMLNEFAVIKEKGPDSVEDVCALFTEDCVLEDTSSAEVTHGRDGLREYCIEFFNALPDLTIEPIEIFDTGLISVMYLRIKGTHRAPWMGVEPTGRRISYRAVAIYRCNEECTMVEYETFAYDAATIIAQLKGEREPEPEDASNALA
ncbi:MAG: ester cyclase [Solirubrobacterales bacterium]